MSSSASEGLLFFALVINGGLAGAIYALIALAFVLVYKASRMINFALGEWIMFGSLAGCYREQAIVLDPFTFLLALLCLNDPDRSGGEHATNRGRSIEQDAHVQRIPVIAKGGRHKSEIERERHSFRQDGDEAKGAAAAVVIVFVWTSFRGLDDHSEVARFRIEGREVRKQGDQSREWDRHQSGQAEVQSIERARARAGCETKDDQEGKRESDQDLTRAPTRSRRASTRYGARNDRAELARRSWFPKGGSRQVTMVISGVQRGNPARPARPDEPT